MTVRGDFGRLNNKLAKACGGSLILQFYLHKLQQATAEAQQDQSNVRNWSHIESVLQCITDICEQLKPSQLPQLKDVVLLIFQLPGQYSGLKRAGCLCLSEISLLMKGMGEVVRDDVKTFIEYVATAIENKYLIFPGARAFKEICGDHAQVIESYAAQIIDRVIP